MPAVRIFLPTYRRPRLLERAVASLRAQTFTDWICELHNDAPDDHEPAHLLARLRDERFVYRRHERNLGAVATFNLFFRPPPELFYSMLEDDNWWEPCFLETMLAHAAAFPQITVLWSNMRVWQERPVGSFDDTGRLTHALRSDGPELIRWGQTVQLYGPIHSNGAMLVRSRSGDDFRVPTVPQAMVEPFRERVFPYPLLFVPEPLANFSLTLATARSLDRSEWAVAQVMLATTFLRHANLGDEALKEIWRDAAAAHPPQTTTLLFTSFLEPTCHSFLRCAASSDWVRLLRGAIRRPLLFWRVLRSRQTKREWWDWLDRHSAARFRESRSIA
jgi:glycosyltransferase involved in cell wall biosynthesis